MKHASIAVDTVRALDLAVASCARCCASSSLPSDPPQPAAAPASPATAATSSARIAWCLAVAADASHDPESFGSGGTPMGRVRKPREAVAMNRTLPLISLPGAVAAAAAMFPHTASAKDFCV